MLFALPAVALRAAEASSGATLAPDTTTTVDLTVQQAEAEQAAARRRAEIAASLPGAAERERIVPEILLLQREVLNELPVISSRPDGATQTWIVRSAARPELYAQRVIPRLLRAGFSGARACAGEEWSGTHGGSRVAVRVEERAVAVVLVRADAPCPAQ